MTTEEKILKLRFRKENNSVRVQYNVGVEEAAEIAKEADFLMKEMVEFLETTVSDSPSDRMWKETILDKYRNWEKS